MASAKIAISLPADQHEAIQQIAKQNGITRSEVIQAAIRKLLGEDVLFLQMDHTVSNGHRDKRSKIEAKR